MYDLYVAKSIQEGEELVSSDAYRRIFNNEFNLGFGSIKSNSGCTTLEYTSVFQESITGTCTLGPRIKQEEAVKK